MNILAALRHQERLARSGELDDDRRNALDRYHGRPYGDEVEGRSQVVMRDVADTVEWILPSLLKVFAAGDDVVTFDPVGPEDEAQAKQETDYCNHVLMTQNNGFIILHDWFKDALIQRNGYVQVRSVKKTRQSLEQYRGLTDDEFQALVGTEEVEVVEYSQVLDPSGMALHDAAVRQKVEYNCLEVVNIPPERALVAQDWPHLHFEGCPFVEIQDYLTISQLREMGYDVDDKISDEAEDQQDYIEDAREQSQDGTNEREDIESHPAMRRVKVRFAWMRFDEDEDGIAELRRLVVVGTTILENEEDDIIPIAALTPGRLPHEHIGQSVDDWVQDLQRIRTVLTRGFLDNLYLAQHPQTYVDVDRVNLDDLLVNRVGGIRRTKGDPRMAVMEAIRPDTSAMSLQAIEYIDTIRENRTGVTRYNQGMDANTLNKTATGINQIMTASQQRIELIARVFAETGVKALMLLIHAMSIKTGRQRELVKLRNQWVPVDPRAWKTRRDVTVSVGIGTGNKDQQLQHLYAIWQQQMQVMPMGLATPMNMLATLKRIVQNAGFKNADEFWNDPQKNPPPPPPPNPEMMKAQLEAQKMQAEFQMDQQRMQMDAAQKQGDLQTQQQKNAIDLEKAQVELQIKLIDLEIKRQQAQISQETAIVNAQAKLMTASDDMARANEINARND